MATYSRWEDVRKRRGELTPEVRAGVEQDLALGFILWAVWPARLLTSSLAG